MQQPWFPYRLTGAIIELGATDSPQQAVVPLQTHGCYNRRDLQTRSLVAVVPLQTHGCYNPL